MRYVRFWRGSADDFARITHKNEDTMYFVIQPDTNSFTMYLGATELLSGDDLNSSSIDALEDVIISKKLYDRQVLMYDALQECWVNASLDKAAGAYVGPTAEYMGLPGMLPGAPAGSENLFFRSDGKWVEQHIEKVENIDKLQHVELIANITAQWSEVNKNDLIIIEDILFNNLKNDIAYWYDGKEWLSVANSSIPSDYAENDPQAPSYILNRPFYKETVTEPLEITWDGVWGSRPYMVFEQNGFGGAVLVKVSDEYFDFEQTEVSSVTILLNNEEQNFPISELHVQTANDESSKIYFGDDILVASFAKDISVGNIEVHKGTYFFKTIGLVGETEEFATGFVSALQFPSVTYEKYYKLDNNFVDAEWMATESEGVGTKKFSLANLSDALVVGGVVQNFPVVQLDSRPYTEDELKSARLTFDIENVPFAYTVAFTVTIDNALVAMMFGGEEDALFYLISMEEDGILDELPLKKGLYILTDHDVDFSEVSNLTLEIFNATGQTIPNKLPNKFLDLDWIPKTETMQEVLYEGAISGSSSIGLKNEPLLLDLDTVLLFQVGADIREVRGLGISVPIGFAVYLYTLSNGEYIAVAASADNGTQLEYSVESETHVTITLLKRASNPIPSYFLPDGVGSAAVITINNRVEDGIGGHEAEILEAWNGGGRVVLQFTDVSLTLLSFSLNLDGVEALGVSATGRFYLFNPLSRGNGWALELDANRDVPYILYKRAGQTEFAPAFLNSTLTEGSTLPAQEGAVFTAIQEIKNLITPINEALEAALEGGN